MDVRLMSIFIVLGIFFLSVIVFSFVYYSYNRNDADPYVRSYLHALYTSVTIQTTIGLSNPPNIHLNSLKIWVIIQSIITYMVSIGLVFILLKYFYKDDTKNEMKSELQDIRSMVTKLYNKKK